MDTLRTTRGNLWQRHHFAARRTSLLLIMLSMFAIAALVSACEQPSAATTSVPTVTAQVASTPTPKPPTPTTKPVTATPRPATPAPAALTLGSLVSAFTGRFGEPNSHIKRIWWFEPTLSGTATLLSIAATAGSDHVDYIHLTPPLGSSTAWSAQQGEKLIKPFLPPDAQFIKDKTLTAFSEKYVEHVYHSDRLAATFPADKFDDHTEFVSVAPGTFYYYCGGQYEPMGSCVLSIGE